MLENYEYMLPERAHLKNQTDAHDQGNSNDSSILGYFVDLLMPGVWIGVELAKREDEAKAFAETCQLEIHGINSCDKAKDDARNGSGDKELNVTTDQTDLVHKTDKESAR